MTHYDCLERVKKINSDLVALNFTPEMIAKFWDDVFSQCESHIKNK